MFEHGEFYRIKGQGWYTYSIAGGEELLAPDKWEYLSVLNLLSSAGWSLVCIRTYNNLDHYIIKRGIRGEG